MILFSLCTSSTGLRVLLIIKILLQTICTIIPLIIIYRAFSTSFKSVIEGGNNAKKDLPTLLKNLAAGLIIFLIPTIINFTFTSLIDTQSDFIGCINNASLEGVLAAEAREEQEAADKKKQEAEEAQRINKEMQEKRKQEIEEAAKKRAEQGDKRSKHRRNGKLGYELAWVAVQMAGVASDQSAALFEPNAYPWNKINDPRLENEYAIMDATLGKYKGNNAYASCNQAAAGAIAAVVDMDVIPFHNGSGSPVYMQKWLSSHPETYERISYSSIDDIAPGDIFVIVSNGMTHTAIYVGNELAQEKFPGTKANVYQAGYQEGHHARYPQLDYLSNGGLMATRYEVYRPIKRNDNAQYPYPDYEALLK